MFACNVCAGRRVLAYLLAKSLSHHGFFCFVFLDLTLTVDFILENTKKGIFNIYTEMQVRVYRADTSTTYMIQIHTWTHTNYSRYLTSSHLESVGNRLDYDPQQNPNSHLWSFCLGTLLS